MAAGQVERSSCLPQPHRRLLEGMIGQLATCHEQARAGQGGDQALREIAAGNPERWAGEMRVELELEVRAKAPDAFDGTRPAAARDRF